MSLAQAARAWVNCCELVWMLEGTLKFTVPPEKVGSGKLMTPCERMQSAALR